MKKNIKYLIIALSIPMFFLSQTSVKAQTLKQIKEDKEAYFEKQLKEKGEEYLAEEGSEYNEYKRWLRLWESRIAPNESMEDYIKKISESPKNSANLRTAAATPGIDDPWTELGPTDQPATGLTSIGGGDRGVGPTQYFDFYPSNPDIMLASSLAGGLFYSSNKGATWVNAGSDSWTISGCMSAAFSPASSSTWYGCSNLGGNNNRHGVEANFAIGPGGVWATNNAGTTYTLIADQYDFNDPAQGNGIYTTIHKILIDPANAAIGYVATTGGLYKTVNITSVNPTWYHIQSGNIEDIEFKGGSTSVILITRQSTYTATPGLWNQTNDWVMEYSTTWGGGTTVGGSWTNIPPPGGVFIANQSTGGTEPGNLEMTLTQANANLVYVEDLKNSGPNAKIYTCDLSTITAPIWTTQRTLTDVTFGLGRGLGVSNVTSSTVYIGHNAPGYFYKSTNFGATDALLNPSTVNINYHVDVEAITCPPYCVACSNSNDVFIATHGGVSYSSDACATVLSRSSGLGVAEVAGFSQTDEDENILIAGLDHDGSVLTENAESYPSIAWETVYGGDGHIPFIDQTIVTNFFVAPNPGTYLFSNTGGHASSYSVSSPLNSAAGQEIVQNSVLSNYMYYRKLATTGFVQIYRSNDHGTVNSEKISNFGITGPAYTSTEIQEMVCSPSDPNYMYVDIVKNGNAHVVLRNTNINTPTVTAQASWSIITTPGGNGLAASAVDQYDPNIIYMAQYGTRVFICDYTNISLPVFTDISFNLPWVDFPKDLKIEKGSTGLYLASGTDVWYTNKKKIDKGASDPNVWERLTPLPNVPMTWVELNYTNNKVRVGTSGRGMWERNLLCPTTLNLNFNSVAVPPDFYEASYITFTDATLSGSALKTFRATNSIIFNPGFFAEATPTDKACLAFIHGCTSPGNSFKDAETTETGIDELQIKSTDDKDGVQVYPNPNNGSFTIITSNENEKDVFVYDMMGKLVFEKHGTESMTITVDIVNQPKGMYLVKVISNNGTAIKKIINQ